VGHELDLGLAFGGVELVDAEGVDEEEGFVAVIVQRDELLTIIKRAWGSGEEVEEVWADEKGLVVDLDCVEVCCGGDASPSVREGFVASI